MQIDTETRKAIEQIAALGIEEAKKSYIQLPDGHYQFSGDDKERSFKKSFLDVFNIKSKKSLPNKEVLAAIESDFSRQFNFSNFALNYITDTSDTITVFSNDQDKNQYVIRLSDGGSYRTLQHFIKNKRANPEHRVDPNTYGSRASSVRSKAPHLLQAFNDTKLYLKRNTLQIMSRVATIESLHPLLKLYEDYMLNILHSLYDGTCFNTKPGRRGHDNLGKDIGVLPDGCLIHFDPDAIPYTQDFFGLSEEEQQAEIVRSLSLIEERMEEMALPESLRPITNGRYKQFDLFPTPQPASPGDGLE